jgi:hypothetical protein
MLNATSIIIIAKHWRCHQYIKIINDTKPLEARRDAKA